MIVIEVIPFLLLAIGGDNIFLIVKDIQQTIKWEAKLENSEIRIIVVKAFSRHMGSILSCGIMEMSIFIVGIYSPMPAVKVFALNAALAVFLNVLFQVTLLVPIIYYDTLRRQNQMFDVLCCLKSNQKSTEKSSHILSTVRDIPGYYFEPHSKETIFSRYTLVVQFSATTCSLLNLCLKQ